jgi:zinc/manganese transport system substrate-binding protein
MCKSIRFILLMLAGLVAGSAQARIAVLATTADWGALTTELGGDKVDVYVATNALQDVHQVDAKPSLIARARKADLVVATGAELEVGWLPVLLQESGNTKVRPGCARLLCGNGRPASARGANGGRPCAG